MKKRNGNPEKASPGERLDLLALSAGIASASIHLFLLLSVLSRQLKSGWTFGNTVGSGTVSVWIAQAATIPFLLFCIVYCVLRLTGKRKVRKAFLIPVGCMVIGSLLLWGGALLILFL